MATALRKLTGLGGDVRKIAALLQKKAPEGHMLAYISPEEAKILKERGGSGKPHADTGIPSFELDESFAAGGAEGYGGDTSYQTPVDTAASTAPAPSFSDVGGTGVSAGLPFTTGGETVTAPSQGAFDTAAFQDISTPSSGAPYVATARDREALFGETGYGAAASPAELAAAEPKPTQGLADQLSNLTGLPKEALGRLGLAGALGLIGGRTAGRAASQGQAGAQEMKTLAAPYQQAGSQLQAQAQRGELTPAAQQSLQALQAQAAQGAERRGGVGVAQAQQAIEAFRQQLLAQQYDYGLKLSGIGDNIALGAIRTGLQADQYVNQLSNQFYTNMAYIASGMTPNVPGAARST